MVPWPEMPLPLWNLGRKFEEKNELNLSEDLFFVLVFTYIWAEKRTESEWRPFFVLFFWSSPTFGEINRPNLSEDLFYLPFQIPGYTLRPSFWKSCLPQLVCTLLAIFFLEYQNNSTCLSISGSFAKSPRNLIHKHWPENSFSSRRFQHLWHDFIFTSNFYRFYPFNCRGHICCSENFLFP